ncbi:LysR family transcriptional regulator substrate-binding protein, partial [Streptomyces sp.]|uniref:LysR family transcriptional regulator substrate-binding protein n=1 Tax=Streptomyces sp. TaxID=1931 RepID=UPI002F95AC0B
VVVPGDHPLARRTGLRLADLADARWLDAPAAGLPLDRLRAAEGAPRGFRPALRYEGTDVRTLVVLAAAGHGLALLPAVAVRSADPVTAAAAVPLVAPRLVHRTELLRPGGVPAGPVARLLDALAGADHSP